MEKKKREHWHPPFYASYKIDFRKYADVLDISTGYLLEKSSQLDILVTKKKPGAIIDNGIGLSYRAHNIIEYKSPDDLLDRYALLQVVGYACLYIRMEHVQTEDVLLSLVGYHYPKTVIAQLAKLGYRLTEVETGIYLLRHGILPDVQIVLLHQIDPQKYPWLSLIRKRLPEERIDDVLRKIEELEDPAHRELALTVTDLILRRMKENRQKEGVGKMNETRNLFKAEFEAKDAKIEQLEEQLKANDEALKTKEEALKSKDEALKSKDEALKSSKTLIEKLKAEVVRLGGNVAAL